MSLLIKVNSRKPAYTSFRTPSVKGVVIAANYPWSRKAKDRRCDWTGASYATLEKQINAAVPEGDRRDAALRLIAARLKPDQIPYEAALAHAWRNGKAVAQSNYETTVAEIWKQTGCASKGAPYIVRRLLFRLSNPEYSPFAKDSIERAKLANDLLACDGARGLSDEEIAQLKAIAKLKEAAPQSAAGGSTCAAAGGCPK